MQTNPIAPCPTCGSHHCRSHAGHNAPPKLPAASIDGISATTNAAIAQAAKILVDAQAPLIFGLDQIDSASQMAAWKLADRLQATIDSSASNASRSAMQTLHRYGKVSATYGEIRNRSDLLVFWDCDIQSSHACLLELLTDRDVENRQIIFVGDASTATAKIADLVFPLDTPDRSASVQLIHALSAMCSGAKTSAELVAGCGLSNEQVQQLFQLMKSVSYGSLFFKQHDPASEFDLESNAITLLIQRLNSVTRFVGSKLRADFNGVGAETVLSLASGFPYAINLNQRIGRYTGLAHSAAETLIRRNCDAVLMLGEFDTERVDDRIQNWLEKIPVVQLAAAPSDLASVFIPIEAATGDFFRADGVMLSMLPTNSSAAEVLAAIATDV
jgi:formylmethanofuran dehydrogenase subunit B